MGDHLHSKVAAAIFRFAQQHELHKTAKALLKEASKREWDLGAEEAEDDGFDLLKICAAAERRRLRAVAKDGSAEPESGAKTSKKTQRDDSGEQQKPKKCRLKGQQETPQAEATSKSGEAPAASGGPKKNGRKQTSTNGSEAEKQQENGSPGKTTPPGLRRFQRIDESQWTTALPPELKDNSFWKKKNDGFAVKAAEQLGKVRGKDFRHEKSKKKKATWKGCGEIPMTVNSIQFASDSD